jgi:hypothetical protein
MAYDITIGEAYIVERDEGDLEVQARSRTLKSAPAFPGDPYPHQNYRNPAYDVFDAWIKAVGLSDLFKDPDDGLMRAHRGCFRIRLKHARQISKALEACRAAHPNGLPGWCGCKDCDVFRRNPLKAHDTRMDPELARLIWFDWWFRWALKNCKKPVIFNW